MNFCSHCGSASMDFKIPPGDNRPRHICDACGQVFYENPKVVCGALPLWNEKILLCRRAIEPRKGFWTLPAGFMENGETTTQAAIRETQEEALAQLSATYLYIIFNLPHINQVYFFYRANMVNGKHGAGEESLETALLTPEEIPWRELAFPTVSKTLEFYLADKTTGEFPIKNIDIDQRGPNG